MKINQTNAIFQKLTLNNKFSYFKNQKNSEIKPKK